MSTIFVTIIIATNFHLSMLVLKDMGGYFEIPYKSTHLNTSKKRPFSQGFSIKECD